MSKSINKEILRSTLAELGWTQSKLAKALGVSSQSVTNWIKGTDFPRPATLLKLATTLKLGFDKLVMIESEEQPIVAFRKKAGTKTTDSHISNACEVGMLLKPLVSYLSEVQALRTLITSPTTEYRRLQIAVSQTRARLGVGDKAVMRYEQLIGEFKDSGAVLVPVMWGKKQNHGNALHIRLPQEDTTFIFLNLDTHLEDFKFWMSHELAHVYTPALAGTNEGEDFADAFAGALLFPKSCAEIAYRDAKKYNPSEEINAIREHAIEHSISLYTVYKQVKEYAKAESLPKLNVVEKSIHVVRNIIKGSLVSEALFDPMPPEPERYLASCENIFQSDFFHSLERMIHENETGASYIQQVLDVSIQDAVALHKAMSH